ncbi:MAG TPA: hypothetical protein VGM20_13820 [Gemmatimonadales bacterium]|jgi:hypothetical protein
MRTRQILAAITVLAGAAMIRSARVKAEETGTYGHCIDEEDIVHYFSSTPTGSECRTCIGDNLGCHGSPAQAGCEIHQACPN